MAGGPGASSAPARPLRAPAPAGASPLGAAHTDRAAAWPRRARRRGCAWPPSLSRSARGRGVRRPGRRVQRPCSCPTRWPRAVNAGPAPTGRVLPIPVDVLMLVWTDVSTDARVQREATTLAEAGHRVHVIGRAVAPGYVPPTGVTVESAGVAPTGVGRRRRLPAPLRLARWSLLPQHVNGALRRWVRQAEPKARAQTFDIVHAHDFTALPLGARLARDRGVPLVYDAHEFWPGRDRHGRPTPYQNWREKRTE